MSLVGSLEDLNLGDILQIISLSQKSGVLALETTGGGGRIVFLQGLVRGAVVKGGPRDLRGVLVDGGFVSADEFEAAQQFAESEGSDVAAAVAANSSLSSERIDSLCREAVESAVCEMFSWRQGDFSFDVHNQPEPDDPDMLLPTGINAQFLAMEATRMRDEGARSGDDADAASPQPADTEAAFDRMPAEEMFGVVDSSVAEPASEIVGQAGGLLDWGADSSAPVPDAVDTLAEATLHHVDAVAEDAPEAMPLDAAPLLAEVDAVFDAATPVLEAGSDMPELIEPLDEGALGADALGAPDEPIVAPADFIEEPIEEASTPLVELSDLDVAEPLNAVLEPMESGFAPLHEGTELLEADAELEPAAEARAPALATTATDLGDEPSNVPLVIVDPDLVALEWIKYSLKESYEQVHIFQGSEQGLARIRQYLVRGNPPLILIAPTVTVDPLSGIRNTADFIARLKSQSSKLSVLWLHEQGTSAVRGAPADGAVTRPAHRQLTLGGTTPEQLEELARDFAARVRAEAARVSVPRAAEADRSGPGISRDVLERLRDATRALTEASSRGEVLPLVIRFAAESFSRVAMFMVRDGVAAGMAQHGLGLGGGPDDDALREMRVDTESSEWMRTVLQTRKPVQGAPEAAGDRNLVARLGNRIPLHAYLGPIESAGQVIALLYGDNLPDERPMGDTSGLEVVMHHAGLALDRAALERALVEGDSEG
jgi:hypothetical protein